MSPGRPRLALEEHWDDVLWHWLVGFMIQVFRAFLSEYISGSCHEDAAVVLAEYAIDLGVLHLDLNSHFWVQVRRLHETFHEPFRKTLRQSQLRLTPSTVAQDAPVLTQGPAEPLPVDLVTPLEPGLDDEEIIDDLD